MKKRACCLLLLMLLLCLTACATKNGADLAEKQAGVEYLVTQNYGEKVVLEKNISYREDASIMDGLIESGAEIKTSYGGSFVSGINGLDTDNGSPISDRHDWFYYVNGIFSDCGALDYFPEAGEIVWWDYHPWRSSQGTTAVIGCFPEPFLHGFRGNVGTTTILVGLEEPVGIEGLKQKLQSYGIDDVSVEKLNADLLEDSSGPIIVVGEWRELEKYKWIKGLNDAYQKNGTFLHFTGKGLELLNYQGGIAQEITGSAGVIMAIGEGNGDDSPVWLIAGTEKSGTEAALNVLINQPEKIKAAYSIVVFSDKIIKLPLMR